MKKCSKCGKLKDENLFSKHSKTKDRLQSWCRDCKRLFSNPKRKYIQDQLNIYKAEHGCFYCGENDPMKLDFHHKEGKKFTIGGSYHKKWDELIDEIRKCVILCKLCHKRHHMSMRKLST